MLFVLTVTAGAPSAWAQEDDLLQGLGEEEAPAGEAAPEASEPDVDVDAPLDEIGGESAPPDSGTPGLTTEEEPPPTAAPGAEAADKEEEAPSKVDPTTLDRVKAVPRKPVLKVLRLEIAPMFSVSINDAFFTHLTVGGNVVFYPHDSFGIGLSGTYFLANIKSDNQRVVRVGQTAVPAVFNHPTGGGTLDLYWNPIYGKISLANSAIIPFDIYAVVGVGAMVAGPNVRPSFKAGLGQRFFVNEWFGLRIEVVDMVYNDTQQVNNQTRSDIQNFIMFNIGATFFVPPSFDYSTL